MAGETDTGVVQIDSLRLDVRETIRRARAFLDRFDEHVSREAAFLRAHDATLVVADAPPLACAAAAAAGIRSVVCANFTWDWIYRDYSEQPGVDAIVKQIGEAYATAEAGWRLPLGGGFETIDPIIDCAVRGPARTRGPEPRSRSGSSSGCPAIVRWRWSRSAATAFTSYRSTVSTA